MALGSQAACVLGLGKMGAALARRLLDGGAKVQVWNRSPEKATSLAAEAPSGLCTAAATPAEALRAAPKAPVLVMMTDTAAVLALLRAKEFGASLGSRLLINLTSGNPDEGREIAKAVDEVSGGQATYVDGCFSGPPAKARAGTGQLFLSCAHEEALREVMPLLEHLGSVTVCGDIGRSRAVDYAVVDLFFVNLLSFMSNKEMMAREGVDIKQVIAEMKKRLDTVPAALELYDSKMASRSEADYDSNVTVSLSTARSYWASRLPYYESRQIPTDLTDLYLQLLDRASGGEAGPHAEADVSRMQEVVRYGRESSSSSS